MYRKILIALDTTPASRSALAHVCEFAEANHATLTLVTVVATLPPFAFAAGVDIGALEQAARQSAKDIIDEAVKQVPGNVSVTTQIREGEAGHEIVAAAKEAGVELIVLGSRGRGRAASAVFGSVGAYVHFHSDLPLLVVKAPESAEDAPR